MSQPQTAVWKGKAAEGARVGGDGRVEKHVLLVSGVCSDDSQLSTTDYIPNADSLEL